VATFDLLRDLPLVSATAWFALAALQVYRDRIHTWTETFFLAACFFAGFYAVADWLFFNAMNDTSAFLAALMSLTSVALTVLFLFLFTLVYIGRMKRAYWSFTAVATGMLLLLWTNGLEGVVRPPAGGGLYYPVFNPAGFLVFLVYIIAFSLGGVVNLYRLHRIVRESSAQLARRTRGLLLIFVLVLLLGIGTNGYLGLVRNQQIPPPFSTLLLVVAGATIYTLYPGSRQRISEAIRRFQARRYSIKAVLMTYEDGTLIGSKIRPGEKVIDQDLFGATLDVIQNFMRTSFPILRGKSLTSISHGSYTLIMERGRHTYLTVVLEGEESDQLRRQMRDLLLEFEAFNREVLANWQGIPAEARGTDELLGMFFIDEPLIKEPGI